VPKRDRRSARALPAHRGDAEAEEWCHDDKGCKVFAPEEERKGSSAEEPGYHGLSCHSAMPASVDAADRGGVGGARR